MEEPEHLSIFLRDISREWSSISGTAFVELLAIEQRERIGGGGKPSLQNKEETTGILKKDKTKPFTNSQPSESSKQPSEGIAEISNSSWGKGYWDATGRTMK